MYMDLHIEIPPTELYEKIENILWELRYNDEESIQEFLTNACQEFPGIIDIAYRRKRYILHKAVKYNNQYAVGTLLRSCGARKWINYPDKKQRTPIQIAITEKNVEISNSLVIYGANITKFTTMRDLMSMKWESMNCFGY